MGLWRKFAAAGLNLQLASSEKFPRFPLVAKDKFGGVVHQHQHARCHRTDWAAVKVQDLDGERGTASRHRCIGLNRQVGWKEQLCRRPLLLRVVAISTQLEEELLSRTPILQHLDANRARIALRLKRCEGEVEERAALRLQHTLNRCHRKHLKVIVIHVECEDGLHVDAPRGRDASAVGEFHRLCRAPLHMKRHWLQGDHGRADGQATHVGRDAVRLQVHQHRPSSVDVEHHRQDVCANTVVVVSHLDMQEIPRKDLPTPRLNVVDVVLLHPGEVCLTIVDKRLLVAPIRSIFEVEILRGLERKCYPQVARIRQGQVHHRRCRACGRSAEEQLERIQLGYQFLLLINADCCLQAPFDFGDLPSVQRVDAVDLELRPHHGLGLQGGSLGAEVCDLYEGVLHIRLKHEEDAPAAGTVVAFRCHDDPVLVKPAPGRSENDVQALCATAGDLAIGATQLQRLHPDRRGELAAVVIRWHELKRDSVVHGEV
mmetsp:Transcript_52322/g.132210  ORF Transcript_52322/g.132210 Transcript_52322/m.132210 type:complete len:486 (-) Transcript_52322:3033-4490(-)